jgi:transcriptional regulator with XRE-family HTH domain
MDAHLTGRELARVAQWHPSKVSKIENGRQTPAQSDVKMWAAACGAPGELPELLGRLRTLETHYVELRRLFRAGLAMKQRSLAEIESASRTVRDFEPVFIPGLLRTPEYARHRLAEGLEVHGAPDDLDEAGAARIQRQQVLYRSGKTFHIVITEAALRYRLCPAEAHAGQLDRLVNLAALRNLRFGVIPFTTTYPVAPAHGFWAYDDKIVFVEHFTAEPTVTQPHEIHSYLRRFSTFAKCAVYGTEARAVITRALDDVLGG